MIIESLQSGVKFHGKISNWVIIESTKYDIVWDNDNVAGLI